jgi:hypothetical protein
MTELPINVQTLMQLLQLRGAEILRLTEDNAKLRAALEGVLKAGVYNDACECMSCEMARAALEGAND